MSEDKEEKKEKARLTQEERNEFIEDYMRHLPDSSIGEAFRAAKLDAIAAGRGSPTYSTFWRWRKKGTGGRTEQDESCPDAPEQRLAPEKEAEDEKQVKTRLRAMLALYRTLPREDADALYDFLQKGGWL